MNRMLVICALLAGSALPALADEKPTADEANKIRAVLASWGCEGGEIEKESEGIGLFEVDDAKCKAGGQFDFKLDKEFRVIVMSRD